MRKSRENYRRIYGKFKASLWRNLSTGTPPKFFRTILCFVALVYNWYFFQNSRFTALLDSHTNTAISHAFAYSSRWRRKPWQDLLTDALAKRHAGETTCHHAPTFASKCKSPMAFPSKLASSLVSSVPWSSIIIQLSTSGALINKEHNNNLTFLAYIPCQDRWKEYWKKKHDGVEF